MYEIYKKLLNEKGLKNSDISRETGISNMTLSDWKNGKTVPKQDKLMKIADYFEVTVDYLMTGKEKEFEMYSIQLYFYITTFSTQKIAYKISPVGFLLIKWVLLSFWVHNAIPISHFSAWGICVLQVVD